jgi:hypothetical protein
VSPSSCCADAAAVAVFVSSLAARTAAAPQGPVGTRARVVAEPVANAHASRLAGGCNEAELAPPPWSGPMDAPRGTFPISARQLKLKFPPKLVELS